MSLIHAGGMTIPNMAPSSWNPPEINVHSLLIWV